MAGVVLNNQTTSDAYTQACTVVGVPLDEFTVLTDNAVIYQIGLGGNFNSPERYLPRGYHVRHKPGYDSIQFRSGNSGQTATVTFDANASAEGM